MQFINIVVHSVEDMNFRVHLQYDFTKLNLEEHLEVIRQGHVTSPGPIRRPGESRRRSPQRLKHTESDRLQVQIQAYLDNVFDVGTLLEDAETKTAALERVEELEENLATVSSIRLTFDPVLYKVWDNIWFLPPDVGAAAGCGERSHAEDRGAGEAADADQQRAGPAAGRC